MCSVNYNYYSDLAHFFFGRENVLFMLALEFNKWLLKDLGKDNKGGLRLAL